MTAMLGRVRRDFAAAEARNRADAGRDPARLSECQLDAIRRVWADAVSDVPYYSGLVSSGSAPREIRSWADVQAIPVLAREMLQQRPMDFIRVSGPPPRVVTTGGSTATPLRVGVNPDEPRLMRVVKLSAWQSLGYTQGARLFLIWGHSHLLGTGWRGRVNHAKRKLTDTVLGYRRVGAYRLTPEICRAYADEIVRFRPFGIIGYASALDLFARHVQPYRTPLRDIGVRFVLATAEAPPRPDSTELIEDLFGCEMVQEYGGAEFGQVAFKRGRQPFEVYSDLNYVEAAADGTAQVTSLYPRYTPLIRYRVGDAFEGAHALDHGHVVRFTAVAGRVNDMVQLADGASIHSVAVLHCTHQEPSIRNVQLVVDREGVELRLVAEPAGREAMEERVRRRLMQVHPALAQATFRYVDDVETTLAGKRRWLIDRRRQATRERDDASDGQA